MKLPLRGLVILIALILWFLLDWILTFIGTMG